MGHTSRWAVVMIAAATGMVSAVWAEQPATPAGSQSAPATQAASSKPATAAASPQHIMTAQGAVTALDVKSATPSLSITTADGKTQTFAIDLKTTSLWKDGKQVALEGESSQASSVLAPGQQVKVRYVIKDGKELARSIQITAKPQ